MVEQNDIEKGIQGAPSTTPEQEKTTQFLHTEEMPSTIELSPEDKDKIRRIENDIDRESFYRGTETHQQITNAVQERDDGSQKTTFATVAPQKARGSKWFRNFVVGTAALFGVSFGAKGEAKGASLPDSLKNKNEKVASLKAKSDSLESKYNGNEKVDDAVRSAWNLFLDWLAEKGLQGKEELDKGGLGYKLFDEYCKTHETILSRETLQQVREEFLKLRAKMIADVRAGKAAFAEGATEENFLRPVILNEGTGNPLYPGKNFTKFRFPVSKTITFEQAQKDYNKIANKATQSEKAVNEKMTDVLKDKKVVSVKNNGFVKSEEPKKNTPEIEVAKNK